MVSAIVLKESLNFYPILLNPLSTRTTKALPRKHCFCLCQPHSLNSDQENQGHSSTSSHLSVSPSLTTVHLLRTASGALERSNISTSSGLMTTTRKFRLATGSRRSSTFCPIFSSEVSGCFDRGCPGGGFLNVPVDFHQ